MKSLLASGLLVAATLAAGGAPTASLTLTPDELTSGQSALLQIEVSGAFHLASAPVVPLANLEIVAGPSLENRFEWINGRSSSRTILAYRVRALKPGRGSIGPIRLVDTSGRTATTETLSIVVGKAGGEAETAPSESMEDPALIARVEPANPYVGQQTIWTLYLVTRGQATQGEVESLPDFRGFWAEDLEHESNVQPKIWNVRGVLWRAYPMIRKAIFPTRAGKFTIGPARARVAVRRVSFDFFDSPFNDAPAIERASPSAAVTCRQKPGPPGMPTGAFTLKDSVDRTRVPEGSAFSVTAQLAGDGRVADLPAPPLSIEGARVSEPESKLAVKRGAARLSSVKTWQWIVTPEKPGALVVPALSVSVFDPAVGRVAMVAAPPLQAVVEPGPAVLLPPRTPAPAVSVAPIPTRPTVVAGVVGAALAFAALGFWLGRRRMPRAWTRVDSTLSAEARLERLLDEIEPVAAARGGEAKADLSEWRRQLQEIRFAPLFSSRDQAARTLEDEVRKSAARWGLRERP